MYPWSCHCSAYIQKTNRPRSYGSSWGGKEKNDQGTCYLNVQGRTHGSPRNLSRGSKKNIQTCLHSNANQQFFLCTGSSLPPPPRVLSSYEVGAVLPGRHPCLPQLKKWSPGHSLSLLCLLTHSQPISLLRDQMTTPSSPGKATTSRGCWRAQREGEFLQVLQMPTRASAGTCRGKSNNGSVLQFRHTSETERKFQKEILSNKEVYWNFCTYKILRHFSK